MSEPYAARDWSSQPPLIFPDYRSTPLRGPTRPLVPLAQYALGADRPGLRPRRASASSTTI